MMLMERLAAGVQVHPDDVAELMLRPVSEVRADMAALWKMGAEVPEETLDAGTFDVDAGTFDVEDAAYIPDMNRRHARLRALINRKLLEVMRGYDPTQYEPELMAKVALAIPDLERLIKEDDRLAAKEAAPVALPTRPEQVSVASSA
jgi:hypothetical protein